MTLLQHHLTAPGLLNFNPFDHSLSHTFKLEDSAALGLANGIDDGRSLNGDQDYNFGYIEATVS